MSDLQYFGWELALIREYVQSTATWINEAYQKHRDAIRKQIEGMADGEAQDVINDGADSDMLLTDVYPTISSGWTFVSIVSYLEHELVFLCRWIERRKTGSHNFYPKKAVLECCKDQLKVLGIAPPTGHSTWQELKRFQDIRNVLVHRLGEVDEDVPAGRDEDLYKYVAKRDDIAILFQRIKTTPAFCLHAIEAVTEFVKQVNALIPSHLLDPPDPRR